MSKAKQNPAYWRHRISQHVRIVAPIPKISKRTETDNNLRDFFCWKNNINPLLRVTCHVSPVTCHYWVIPCEKSEKKRRKKLWGFFTKKVQSICYFSNNKIFIFCVVPDHFNIMFFFIIILLQKCHIFCHRSKSLHIFIFLFF